MKIATYNVNGINGRLPVLLKWLKDAKPDIVCLQEHWLSVAGVNLCNAVNVNFTCFFSSVRKKNWLVR